MTTSPKTPPPALTALRSGRTLAFLLALSLGTSLLIWLAGVVPAPILTGAGALAAVSVGLATWRHRRPRPVAEPPVSDGGVLANAAAVLHATAAGVVVINRHGRVVLVNPAALELFGLSLEDALGQVPGAGLTGYIDRWGRPIAENALPGFRLLAGEESTDELVGMVGQDGGRVWTSVSGRLLRPGNDPDAPFGVLTISDITSRVTADLASEAEATQLRHRALHDSLTGLPNRTMLMDRLSHATSSAVRRGAATGLILIDLDGFKAVNDTLGHAAGDELLVQVAVRLRTTLRSSDTAARLGGDEFVVLCEDLNPSTAGSELAKISGRIQTLLNEPYVTTLGPADVGASLGWAIAQPGEDLDLELVVAADEAMLSDKRSRKLERTSVMRQVAAPEAAQSTSAKLGVFIVDDDPAMRLLATRILESSTQDLEIVGQASDGASAIAAILETQPDLVLCDVMMPRISGPEVVTSVRQVNAAQRFIFWSATTAPELEGYQQDLGVPFVMKDRIEELPTAIIDAAKLALPGNPVPTAQEPGQLSRR